MKPDGRKASSTLPATQRHAFCPRLPVQTCTFFFPAAFRTERQDAMLEHPRPLASPEPCLPPHTFDKTGEKPHAALKRQSEPGLTSRALRLRREGHSFFLCCQNVAGACSAGPNAFPRHDVFLPFSCPCSQRISFFRHPQNFSAAFCKKRKQS